MFDIYLLHALFYIANAGLKHATKRRYPFKSTNVTRNAAKFWKINLEAYSTPGRIFCRVWHHTSDDVTCLSEQNTLLEKCDKIFCGSQTRRIAVTIADGPELRVDAHIYRLWAYLYIFYYLLRWTMKISMNRSQYYEFYAHLYTWYAANVTLHISMIKIIYHNTYRLGYLHIHYITMTQQQQRRKQCATLQLLCAPDWVTKRPASRKSVMPLCGRIFCCWRHILISLSQNPI